MFTKTKQETPSAISPAVSALEQAKAVVEAMAGKLETARRHGENLAAERGRIALRAHAGNDEAARERLVSLNLEIAAHASELASVESALTEARANVDTAAASVASEDQARRQAEARRVGDLILAEAAKFDAAAAAMAEALQRRRDLHLELAKTGVIATPQHNQLVRPMAVTRALVRAGVAQFTDISHIGAHLVSSLEDHDAQILGRPTSTQEAA